MNPIIMKTKIPFQLLVCLTLIGLPAPLSTARAQGSLTPPGAPTPTMLTLNQIQPRIPISAPYNISLPGSYYLTTNIVVNFIQPVAISINASDVTLDLNGFTLSTTANYSASTGAGGIELGSGLSDVTILNGHIRGGVTYSGGTYSEFGFGDGISYSGTQPINVHVSGVSVSGCYYYGINLGTANSTMVDGCTVQTVGNYGIEASSVCRSTAYQCGNTGIIATSASDCIGYGINGDGLDAITALNCYGISTNSDGINVSQNANNCYGASSGSAGTGLVASTAESCVGQAINLGLSANTANNCYANGNNAGGIYTHYVATSCFGISSVGYGIQSYIADSCYGANTGSTAGIDATIANSCFSSNGDGKITNKYNMP